MSSSYASAFSFDTLCRAFAQHAALPFGKIFTPELLTRLACRYNVCFAAGPNDFWGVGVTTMAWLFQGLFAKKSCLAAVSRVVALCVLLGLAAPSSNTGAFCKARDKLSADFLRALALSVSRSLEEYAPARWRWRGRRVILIDGTTLNAPDTPTNQAEYPQHSQQAPGLGFPVLRMVVLFGLATASLLACAFGRYEGEDTGETALLRVVLDELEAGDILVADRYYCTWWLLALTQERGILVCFRLCAARKEAFPRGTAGNAHDYQSRWSKPKRPDWMDQETYERLPDSLAVRIVDYAVPVPGFRPDRIRAATTLLCGKTFPEEDIADLYHKRWHVEVDIRTIKQTMQMEELSCLTPAMLQAEIWTHWLSYNLARLVAAQAALSKGLEPRQISFSGVRANLESFYPGLVSSTAAQWQTTVRALWRAVVTHKVGGRSGRSEPREKKRREKHKYPPLSQPRKERRAALARQKAAEADKARQQRQAQEEGRTSPEESVAATGANVKNSTGKKTGKGRQEKG
jgi:putative transposase